MTNTWKRRLGMGALTMLLCLNVAAVAIPTPAFAAGTCQGPIRCSQTGACDTGDATCAPYTATFSGTTACENSGDCSAAADAACTAQNPPGHRTGDRAQSWRCVDDATGATLDATGSPVGGTDTSTEQPESQTAEQIRERECPPASEIFPLKLSIAIGGVSEVSGLAQYINEIYRYGVAVVLVAAIVMVVWGGFRYLIGAGVGGVERGKEIIRDAIAGMLIVLAAYLILQTINPATTNLSPPSLPAVGCQPLVLTPTLEEGRCNTNADCDEGESCVETDWVYESSADFSTFATAEVVATVVTVVEAGTSGSITEGASAGSRSFLRRIGRTIKQCSNGRAGSPCGEDEHCTESGVSCMEGWKLCSRESGLSARMPCDDDHQCAGGEDRCIGGGTIISSGQRLCRGSAPILTQSHLRAAGFNLDNIPSNLLCNVDHDCAEAGARCSGPAGSLVKFCFPGSAWVSGIITETFRSEREQITDGSLCFRSETVILPGSCNGTGTAPYTCMVCPASGERNWEPISSTNDPERTRIGSCKPRSSANTTCTGGSTVLPSGLDRPAGGF